MRITINIRNTKRNQKQYNRLVDKVISLLVQGKGKIDMIDRKDVKFDVQNLELQ